jgi:hypothetical protein
MSNESLRFDDEPPAPQPRRFWIPRMLITGLCAGLAAAAYLVFGFGSA